MKRTNTETVTMGEASQHEMFDTSALGKSPYIPVPRPAPAARPDDPPPIPIPLDGDQLEAAEAIHEFFLRDTEQTFCVHGLAGTGKTHLLASLSRSVPGCILLSPTGKAATVLARKTGESVMTLHKLLYEPDEDKRGRLVFHKKVAAGSCANQIALVDEASMIDTNLANDLLETGICVVATGDPGQLPPVNGVQFFSEPNFTLHQIRRQAQDSPIIRQAHAVREGRDYASDGDAFQVVGRSDVAAIEWADIVLCWKNETRHRINRFVRRKRGIEDRVLPQEGEPVICLENHAEMMNGEISTIRGYHKAALLLANGMIARHPWLEWREAGSRWPRGADPFGLAYCITVHKAQGSEWPRVTIIDDFTGRDDRARWLYTAITRASEAVRIVARE
jgi:exodeoxyribonuclease-5